MSAIPSWCRVGAKVVCIEAFVPRYEFTALMCPSLPVQGGIYTIRAVANIADGGAIRLVEVVNPVGVHGYDEIYFDVRPYFRPIVPTKTEADDVAYFKSLTHLDQHSSANPPERVGAVDG